MMVGLAVMNPFRVLNKSCLEDLMNSGSCQDKLYLDRIVSRWNAFYLRKNSRAGSSPRKVVREFGDRRRYRRRPQAIS